MFNFCGVLIFTHQQPSQNSIGILWKGDACSSSTENEWSEGGQLDFVDRLLAQAPFDLFMVGVTGRDGNSCWMVSMVNNREIMNAKPAKYNPRNYR